MLCVNVLTVETIQFGQMYPLKLCVNQLCIEWCTSITNMCFRVIWLLLPHCSHMVKLFTPLVLIPFCVQLQLYREFRNPQNHTAVTSVPPGRGRWTACDLYSLSTVLHCYFCCHSFAVHNLACMISMHRRNSAGQNYTHLFWPSSTAHFSCISWQLSADS